MPCRNETTTAHVRIAVDPQVEKQRAHDIGILCRLNLAIHAFPICGEVRGPPGVAFMAGDERSRLNSTKA